MAFSLNKVMLIGNLGGDAETRFSNETFSVTNFTLATTRSYKKNEEWVNETTWHNVVSYNLSDFYKEQLKKGKKVFVEGRISKRSYQDKNNETKYVFEVIAESLIPLDKSEGFSGESSGNVVKDNNDDYSTSKTDDDLPF